MKKQIPTVMFLSGRSDIAGGEVYLLSVMRHLDPQRFQPIVILPSDGSFRQKLDSLGVENLVLEANFDRLNGPTECYSYLKQIHERAARLVDIIRHRQILLIHTNSNKVWDGAFAARLAGIHHIHVAHIEYLPSLPVYQRFPLQMISVATLMGELSTRTIAVSDHVARTLSPSVPADLIRVIYNGVEIETYDRALTDTNGKLRAELGIPLDTVLITAVGRLHPDKGFDYLVEAAAQVLAQSDKAQFLVVGQTDDQNFASDLRQRAKSLGIDGRFVFLGYRQDVPQILAESDIFVLSSRTEGGPYVLLEAMACGCAPVSTRCGGNIEQAISDGECGYLVSNGDISGLASKLCALVNDPAMRQRMAAAARQRIRERFESSVGVRKLMAVYDEVLASPRPVGGSVMTDLFLRGAAELGTLGLKVAELEDRLQQVEHLSDSLRRNMVYKLGRQLKHWWSPGATGNR
jgi:glycosyltransferase involved in cell wall biosynthesis